MQNIDSDLIRGNIDTIILKTMLNEDKYGLDIIKEVSDKSSGTYVLKQPTLYSCLKRLENQELISSYWVDSDIGGKRHYYKLTEKGREFYNKKQEEWAKSKFIIDNLLSNYNYEEYRLVKKDEYDEILQNKANAPLYNSTDEITNNEETNESLVEENSNDPIENNETKSTDLENLNFSEDANIDENSNSEDDFESQDEEFDSDIEQEIDDNDIFNFNTFDEIPDEESEEPAQNDADDDYPVYFSAKPSENTEEVSTVSYETSDQTSNELNILSRLRDQEDEDINTYYGDQKSYVNHLNQLDESQLEQQDLLDSSLYVRPDEVNKMVDEFSTAIANLNNFNSEPHSDATEDESNSDETFESESINIDSLNLDALQQEETDEEFDELDELHNLKNLSSNSFFDSDDYSGYNKTNTQSPNRIQEQTSYERESFDYDNDNNSSSMSFEEISHEIEPDQDINYDNLNEFDIDSTEETENSIETFDYDSSNNMNDIDAIISNNITSTYTEPTYAFYKNQSNSNYKNKLSDLSRYSRVTLEESKTESVNEEALEKAKDISEITKELEEEGIKVKEHYKQLNENKFNKHYLLSNKINLVKSLIMFFGYVFILSALYIVLNNTSMKDNSWFSIKPFLLGFIPFAVILIYHGILFAISPYKKIDSKFHFRIMFFISIIIAIQLLLITYCLNLQLGFYSFSQQGYNHLYWIIPSIISIAPVIDNLVYLALFKSRNFNV